MTTSASMPASPLDKKLRAYRSFVLLVAGIGGLLYGVDIGIIGGALPYLEATSKLNAGQLSVVVAAVLLGSVFSTLFAGMLADWTGRKPLMVMSGLAFVISIPVIALSQGYGSLFLGRLLQGVSGGFIGVVVPLYLAECLPASTRGKGTAVFQWLLTFGIFLAAVIAFYYSLRVERVARFEGPAALLTFKDHAWRRIFWVSLPPGVLFVLGSILIAESPRWLFQQGREDQAYAALLRSRTPEQSDVELTEMRERSLAEVATRSSAGGSRETLLQRKYIIPFVLACVILFCNTATGINSIIGYNTSILLQSGLSDLSAHIGYVVFTLVNFVMTIGGVALIDKKGRKFLFILGTSGIAISLLAVGLIFQSSEKLSLDSRQTVQSMVNSDQTLRLVFDPAEAQTLLNSSGYAGGKVQSNRASLAVIYSYGDFTAATSYRRSDDNGASPIVITRESCVPANRIEAFFKNPFADWRASQTAPLKINQALIGQVPSARHGWMVAIALYLFMTFFAVGPGVCVWLALSELMPTRIRSNGMSIALVINQIVSTTLAGIFLPVVSKYGYSTIFFMFAGFSIVYLATAVFFLPETKGKTLEEIEQFFDRGRRVERSTQ